MSTTYSKWNKEDILYLQNNYHIRPACDIATALNKSLYSIYGKASQLKLKSFTDSSRRWNDDELYFLKNNYLDMTHQEIADCLGRTKTAVDLKLSKLGLKKSKYVYDKTFFDCIDTEDKAYWLGFIYANGYIHIDKDNFNHELGIQLQWRDYKHLQKFNKAISGNVAVKKKTRINPFNGLKYDMCEIRFYSKRLTDSLFRYHLSNGKSNNICFPSDLPENLIHHFIRGFFDGDGCISCDNKKGKTISLNFCCASKDFLEKLRSILYKNNIYSYIYRERAYSDFDLKNAVNIDGVFYKNTYRLYIKGISNTVNMIKYLYLQNSTIYLERKYRIAIDNYCKLAQRLPRHSETSDFLLQ